MRENIGDIFLVNQFVFSCKSIKRAVCEEYKIKIVDLEVESADEELFYYRQIAMYLCRKMRKLSYAKIGESFGKSKSTANRAYQKISQEIAKDPELRKQIEDLMEKII